MQVIESLGEVQNLTPLLNTHTSYWFPMWVDMGKHPMNTQLSFVFIRVNGMDYILTLKHTDASPLTKADLETLWDTDGEKWVFGKKKWLQTIKSKRECKDFDTYHYISKHSVFDYEKPFQPIINSLTLLGYHSDVVQSLPLLKLGGVIEQIMDENLIGKLPTNFDWYNNVCIPVLSRIEEYGVRVDKGKIIDRWSQSTKHITASNTIYTEYNPYTTTGRPSNRHGGINYSALNKSDGSRDCFISDGIFLQMDYDAYHPRIIGKLIGFELPKTSVHQWLADQYGCELGEGKGITFRLLYGGIDDAFRQIPFLNAVADYIIGLWDKSVKQGYLQTQYRKIPLNLIEDPNPQKVFNYLLQAIETEMNIDKLRRILDYIEGSDIRFSLYTYDSFLFDVPTDVDKNKIKDLKEIIEVGGFPIKASWGLDYGKV
jgi:hypothetical protein